ncbi:TIGR03089 family protein [Actinophytocola xanthii]|uniref:TIGR03089 family protein n=1 Tax=Actinophytocola xanthii TaxID=1912961 RepID=A0A1Q8C1N9_9PSEU|nr:TIGR03089 family protein [Actinophytocola xanthii]OLF08275.1 TIGR03089 family protein [Actinophytocola xanthii]
MSLTETLLRPYRGSPARPLVTHYDDAAGSRVELSVATLVNWAAKTANWLVEERDVEPGDPVAVLLPAHWQTAGVLLGAWWCGAHVVGSPAGASVTFVPPEVPDLPPGSEAAVVSLDPMGRDLGGAVASGTLDFIADARLQGDDFFPLAPVPPDTPCLAGATVEEVLTQAATQAKGLDLTTDSRVLSTQKWTIPEGVLTGLVTVLSAGASLVQVTNPAPDRLSRHKETERTTVEL